MIMGFKVELLSGYEQELRKWEDRKGKAMERAKIDLNLILPLVEDYYNARKPEGDKVVYEWEVGRGLVEFERFLNGFIVACAQFPESRIKVSK